MTETPRNRTTTHVMMVHGLIGSLDYFCPAERLPDLRIHTIDLQGYGQFASIEPSSLSLTGQVNHVQGYLEKLSAGPVWLLGHSMGGAIIMRLADRRPDLVLGLINIEGNFTRKDAFWSARIANMSDAEWADEYQAMRSDPAAWLERCEIDPTSQRVTWATRILDHQPHETVRSMSRSLVEETSHADYLDTLRRVVERKMEIHLIAGERSEADWDVPLFVREAATSFQTIDRTGHLMMLEAPNAFCEVISGLVMTD